VVIGAALTLETARLTSRFSVLIAMLLCGLVITRQPQSGNAKLSYSRFKTFPGPVFGERFCCISSRRWVDRTMYQMWYCLRGNHRLSVRILDVRLIAPQAID